MRNLELKSSKELEGQEGLHSRVRGIQGLEGVSRLKGGQPLGSRSHGARWPCRMLRRGSLLGVGCLRRRVPIIQLELFLCHMG